MNLAVIIPSKSIQNLIHCVESVQHHEEDCDVFVVDDGIDWSQWPRSLGTVTSLEGDEEFCPGCGVDYRDADVQCRCQTMRMMGEKPFIFARNVNIGIRNTDIALSGDAVVILNDDALLHTPGGFTLMQRAAEEHPEFGIIGATTNITGQPLQQPRNIGLREVPHFAFVCVLIPRRTIDRVGLLDERYCLDYGCEDRDYCEAVTRAGLKVGVHDGCYVDHGSLTSTFRGSPRTPKSFAQNYELFKAKWGLRA